MTSSKLIRTTLTLATVAAAGLAMAGDASFTGTCTRVVDGDTLVVARDGRQITVELAGVDAPELGQPFGKEVRTYLRKLVQGNEVEVTVSRWEGDTAFGRVVADGGDLSTTLATQGLARVTGDTADAADLEALQRRARSVPSGIWLRQDPALPWNEATAAS